MLHQPWFQRRWDFDNIDETFESTKARLSGAIQQLKSLTADIPQGTLIFRPDGKWSVKEHIGHLILLEALWRLRFMDIRENKEEMTLADTENRATSEGGFNENDLSDLLARFSEERTITMRLLESMSETDLSKCSRHPRLGQSFRVVDLAYFVCEHDSHHFESICEIKAAADR